jgi:signal transduction histidine kinase
MSELERLRARVAELEGREEQLRQAEVSLARLATFPEQNPNPIIETDLDGRVTYLNPAARARFPDLQETGITHPVLTGLEAVLEQARRGEEASVSAELEVDGRTYEHKTKYTAQSSVVRVFASDLTDLKQAEASLARLASFPEQNPNPVIEMDLDGALTYRNPAAREQFPDLVERGKAHPVLAGFDTILDRLERGEEATFQAELEIDGRIYEQKTTYMEQTQLVRVFASDISELKALQTQLRDSLEALEHTNKDLLDTQVQLVQSEKMAAMASLVAGIAHEINTPIGAISSVHDTLRRAVDKLTGILSENTPEGRPDSKSASILRIIADASTVINTASDRVITIVDSMKSFARLDEAELKSVDIHEGLEDTVRLVQHDLGTRIQIVRDYGEMEPIVCYPSRLNQVFLCMVVNAIDAIEGEGTIEIRTRREGEELHVSIHDSGAGIPPENMDKIFQPGFTTKGVGIGTGLGLSICYQILQDHRGRIEVDSAAGEGSTFTTVLTYEFDN